MATEYVVTGVDVKMPLAYWEAALWTRFRKVIKLTDPAVKAVDATPLSDDEYEELYHKSEKYPAMGQDDLFGYFGLHVYQGRDLAHMRFGDVMNVYTCSASVYRLMCVRQPALLPDDSLDGVVVVKDRVVMSSDIDPIDRYVEPKRPFWFGSIETGRLRSGTVVHSGIHI